MKTSFRAFGIGLFLAGMCLALVNQFDLLPAEDQSAAYKKEIKALEKELADLQQTLEDNQSATSDDNEELDVEEPQTTPSEPQTLAPSTPEDVTAATIFIYEGMSLYDIGQQVEGEGIVGNGRELELYLARPEYARSIQKGSFDLHSAMTIEEIAKILTGKIPQQ